MSGIDLSNRDRRTLSAGALSIGLILGVAKGLPALRSWESARIGAAAEVRQTLLFEEQGLALLPRLRDSLAVRSRRVDSLRNRLLAGATPESAAGILAALVERLAEAEGLEVETVALKPDTVVRRGFARVEARLTAQGDVDGLLNFLYAIDTHRALLAVRSLNVTQPDPGAPSSRADALRIDVAVQALARMSASSPRQLRENTWHTSPLAALTATTRIPRGFDADSLEEASLLATDGNPFRLSRAPAEVAFVPQSQLGAQAARVPTPRPILLLKGIVGGPPWQAIIDGIPGQPTGTIATAGAEFDKLTIRSVSRDSVVVRGPDTTWVLTFTGRTP